MTSIQIGKAVKAVLSASSALVAKVGTKIFPIVSKEGTTYPFVVYRRNGIDTTYTKDGRAGEVVNMDIVVAASTYIDSVEVADLVRDAIDGKAFTYHSMTVKGVQMVAADEDFIEDVYTQTLNFNLYL